MMDNKYRKDAFEASVASEGKADELVEQLTSVIEGRIFQLTRKAVEDLVGELNSLGHDLRLYDELPDLYSIHFRDDKQSDQGYRCSLRVAVNTVVSVGFNDTEIHSRKG